MAKASLPKFSITDMSSEKSDGNTILLIRGLRSGRPNKRFTLASSKIKVQSAQVEHHQKNKVIVHSVSRINYLPTINQTRLHTTGLLYPGEYYIKLVVGSGEPVPPVDQLFI